jgi:hypothetical protein
MIGVRHVRQRLNSAWLVFIALTVALFHTSTVRAEPSPADRAAAAAAYDEGAELFERAQYGAAAQAFLRADDRAPSTDALRSSLTAVRKSNDYLLVVKVAERALAREASDPKLAASGRQALLEASQHLSRIDLDCAPKPCSVSLDGTRVASGISYALPGTHVIGATATEMAAAEERIKLDAGSTYHAVLHPKSPADATKAAPSRAKAGTSATHNSPPVSPAAEGAHKPLPRGVFYAGVATTLVLAAVTVWSGLDTLSARDNLPERPHEADIDGVRHRILRSNVLFGGTVLVGAATTYAGLRLVDWSPSPSSKNGTLVPVAGGALLSVTGRF